MRHSNGYTSWWTGFLLFAISSMSSVCAQESRSSTSTRHAETQRRLDDAQQAIRKSDSVPDDAFRSPVSYSVDDLECLMRKSGASSDLLEVEECIRLAVGVAKRCKNGPQWLAQAAISGNLESGELKWANKVFCVGVLSELGNEGMVADNAIVGLLCDVILLADGATAQRAALIIAGRDFTQRARVSTFAYGRIARTFLSLQDRSWAEDETALALRYHCGEELAAILGKGGQRASQALVGALRGRSLDGLSKLGFIHACVQLGGHAKDTIPIIAAWADETESLRSDAEWAIKHIREAQAASRPISREKGR